MGVTSHQEPEDKATPLLPAGTPGRGGSRLREVRALAPRAQGDAARGSRPGSASCGLGGRRSAGTWRPPRSAPHRGTSAGGVLRSGDGASASALAMGRLGGAYRKVPSRAPRWLAEPRPTRLPVSSSPPCPGPGGSGKPAAPQTFPETGLLRTPTARARHAAASRRSGRGRPDSGCASVFRRGARPAELGARLGTHVPNDPVSFAPSSRAARVGANRTRTPRSGRGGPGPPPASLSSTWGLNGDEGGLGGLPALEVLSPLPVPPRVTVPERASSGVWVYCPHIRVRARVRACVAGAGGGHPPKRAEPCPQVPPLCAVVGEQGPGPSGPGAAAGGGGLRMAGCSAGSARAARRPAGLGAEA